MNVGNRSFSWLFAILGIFPDVLGKILCIGVGKMLLLQHEMEKECQTDLKLTIMKKMIFAMIALLTFTVKASAMSYEQARNEALFLTDKMAYELNLTDAQYEAAYEINLDYLMSVSNYNDVFGTYWERRNLDLSYILYSWQWEAFRAATYFYRPLYWDGGYWHFGIYARYPHRDYFYFGRPHFYATYRGGHSWHMNGGRSYYHGHSSHFRPEISGGRQHFGMRNSFDRGDFRNSRGNSSTRVTAGRGDMNRGGGHFDHNGRSGFGASRPANGGVNSRPQSGSADNNRSFSTPRSNEGSRSSGSFGASHGNSGSMGSGSSAPSRSSGSFGNSRGNSGSMGSGSSGPSRSSGSFSNSRGNSGSMGSGSSATSRSSGSTSSGSFGGSRSSGSFGGGSRSGGGSMSSGSSGGSRSSGSFGGGSRGGGGSSHGSRGGFGGHR